METREETLEKEFVYATECQLATLEDLRVRKGFPKYELERHESIARQMLAVCKNEKLKTRFPFGRIMSRVQERLETFGVDTANLNKESQNDKIKNN